MDTKKAELHEPKKAIAELSIEARLLYARLKECAVNDIVDYDELSGIAKRDVQGDARGQLHTAIGILERDDQMFFETVRATGIKRISNDTTVLVTHEGMLRRTRRLIRKGTKRLTRVDYDSLEPATKVTHNTALSLFGALSLATKEKQVKRIEQNVITANGALPAGRILELCQNGKED